MKKIKMILLSAMFLIVSLTGCSNQTSGANSKDSVKILLTITDLNDDFRLALADSAKSTAQAEGIQLDVVEADGSVEKQVEQIKNSSSQGYNVIICNPIDTATTLQMEAMANNLPIVFINSAPDASLLEKDKYMYVGSDGKVAGQYQAEYLLSKYASKNEWNIILLKGEKGHSGAEGRTSAFKETMEASGKKINYLFEDNADWSEETAAKMVSLFVKTGQRADAIVANNDAMALGAVAVSQSNNLNIPVLGVDATTNGCKAIQDGTLAFTVYQSAPLQGEAAVNTAIALGKGSTASSIDGVSEDGKYVWVPFEKVDQSNVSNYSK